jgi:UDP-N-acetyl-D-mannosaminuronic acid dehydrogenase
MEILNTQISVLGLGYIGLPTSLAFVNSGFFVTGIDVNSEVVKSLNSGQIHIEEVGLQEYFDHAIASKRFMASETIIPSDVFLIAVPTPIKPDKSADLDAVKNASHAIADVIQKGNMVILESTVPPGTCENIIAPIIESKTTLKHGIDYDLVHCPERVIPGSILREITENDRIIGGTTPEAAQRAKNLYSSFVKGKIIITTAATAEITKLMENTYRDINIALANELSLVCESLDINIHEAIQLANHHPRVNIHQPGIGVGGHCIPIDPWFIAEISPRQTPLIQTARKINDAMPKVTAHRIEDEFNALNLKKEQDEIGILGLTYKSDVDDFRESPAIEVVHELLELGYKVKVFDPYLLPKVQLPVGTVVATFSEVKACSLVRVLVNHSQFKSEL